MQAGGRELDPALLHAARELEGKRFHLLLLRSTPRNVVVQLAACVRIKTRLSFPFLFLLFGCGFQRHARTANLMYIRQKRLGGVFCSFCAVLR